MPDGTAYLPYRLPGPNHFAACLRPAWWLRCFRLGDISPMSEADNKLLARRFLEEVVNTGAVERLPEFLASDFIGHDAGLRGMDGAREHIQTFRRCYPDLRVTVDGQVAEDDIVVTWFTMQATHLGAWGELKPTGRAITLRGINIQRVRDGRITEQWGAANTFEALFAIGAIRFNTNGGEAGAG